VGSIPTKFLGPGAFAGFDSWTAFRYLSLEMSQLVGRTDRMGFEIRRESAAILPEYGSIPMAFDVREVVDLESLRVGAPGFQTRSVRPWRKDYDAMAENSPRSWRIRRDVSDWVFLIARVENEPIAGAVVITDPTAVTELGGRGGNGLLFDLRVAPTWRRRGLGRALIIAAEEIARDFGVPALDIETQDTNVPACRLYSACGYSLTGVHTQAYAPLTDDAKLWWTKRVLSGE
jgi:ribosomal protein S18 acetylase RimI-like enzyme